MRVPTISRVEVYPVELPITRTFVFASGSAGEAGAGARLVFVRVLDEEGRYGWGECRPMPGWSYETLETVVTTLRRHLIPAVVGTPASDLAGLHARMHAAIGRGPSTGQPIARSALDMAVHDLLARALGLPLRALLGGSPRPASVALSYTVTAASPEAAAQEVSAARAKGFEHFNFKVGVHPETDVQVARAIREAAGPEAFVWADANQGLAVERAARVAEGLAEAGVDVLEQPFAADKPHLMRAFRGRCPLPLAVDEASVSPSDFLLYASEGLVDYLVVKVTRSGGLWPSIAQVHIAQAFGLPLLISGLTDSMLTKMAACQLGAAFGCQGPAALNGSQFIDDSALFPTKAQVEHDGRVWLPELPGVGIEPDIDTLRSLEIKEV